MARGHITPHRQTPGETGRADPRGAPRIVSLTRKQRDLLDYIGSYIATEGIGPSYEEMKDAMGLHSKSGIFRLMEALEERGFLRRIPNRARAIELFDVEIPPALPARRPLQRASTEALIAELVARGFDIPVHPLCAAAKREASASPS